MARRVRQADGNGGATAIEDLQHPADVTRLNIPTAEMQSYMAAEEAAPKPMLYPRNPDLDPSLYGAGRMIWTGRARESQFGGEGGGGIDGGCGRDEGAGFEIRCAAVGAMEPDRGLAGDFQRCEGLAGSVFVLLGGGVADAFQGVKEALGGAFAGQ